jgi:mono/diheme cytochrome c family protein
MRWTVCAITSVLSIVPGTSGFAQGDATRPFAPEQVKKGSALYKTHCESCHGVRMMGPPWGADLTQFPRDNPGRFADSVTHGRNAMPPWGDLLSSDDISALWAYVVAGEPNR